MKECQSCDWMASKKAPFQKFSTTVMPTSERFRAIVARSKRDARSSAPRSGNRGRSRNQASLQDRPDSAHRSAHSRSYRQSGDGRLANGGIGIRPASDRSRITPLIVGGLDRLAVAQNFDAPVLGQAAGRGADMASSGRQSRTERARLPPGVKDFSGPRSAAVEDGRFVAARSRLRLAFAASASRLSLVP